MFNSLTALNLNDSTNFSYDTSVTYLALMLAKAQYLKFVDIANEDEVRGIEIQVSKEKKVEKKRSYHVGGIIEEG